MTVEAAATFAATAAVGAASPNGTVTASAFVLPTPAHRPYVACTEYEMGFLTGANRSMQAANNADRLHATADAEPTCRVTT